jgi:hypothetical protein
MKFKAIIAWLAPYSPLCNFSMGSLAAAVGDHFIFLESTPRYNCVKRLWYD